MLHRKGKTMADSTNTRDTPVKADPSTAWPTYAIEWDKWTPQVESAIVLDLMGLQQEHRHSGFHVYTQSTSDIAQFKRVLSMLRLGYTESLPIVNGTAKCDAAKLYYVEKRPVVTYYADRTYQQNMAPRQLKTRLVKDTQQNIPAFAPRERPLPPAMNPQYKPMPSRKDGQYILPPWAQLY